MIVLADAFYRGAVNLSTHGATILTSHRRAIADILPCRIEAVPNAHSDQTERRLAAPKTVSAQPTWPTVQRYRAKRGTQLLAVTSGLIDSRIICSHQSSLPNLIRILIASFVTMARASGQPYGEFGRTERNENGLWRPPIAAGAEVLQRHGGTLPSSIAPMSRPRFDHIVPNE